MARMTYEGMEVVWATTVASLAAPTVANITAGTNLSGYVPVAGVNLSGTQNTASLAMLGDAFIVEGIGTHGKSLVLTFTRDAVTADDDAWALFTYKLAGHIILARSGALTASSKVEVYQVECGEKLMNPSAENEIQQFTVQFAIQAYNQDAVIAA